MKELGDFKSSFSILAKPHDEVDSPEAEDIKIKQGCIEFKQLSFAYDHGNPVFSDLSLSIKAGEKIGLIGHSGAGKSTLISLLLKNFKPTSGTILIDNVCLDKAAGIYVIALLTRYRKNQLRHTDRIINNFSQLIIPSHEG